MTGADREVGTPPMEGTGTNWGVEPMKQALRLLIALAPVACVSLAVPLAAQHPSEFTARDKTEVFIQHVVKFMKVEPSEYQAMVLEYEIGTILSELAGFELAQSSNFIRRALKEFHPGFAAAQDLFDAGKDAEAVAAVEPLLRALDPYVLAHAELLRAELHFRAGEYDKVIERAERVNLKHRIHVIDDHRACELIALAFEKQERPLLEFAQYAILLIDYEDLPKDLETRAKKRLEALNETVGRPLHTVASWMNQVERLLSRELTGEEPTQVKERQIVSALDKLIELQEAKERNTCSSCGGGNCKGGCKNGKGIPKNPGSPRRVSLLPDGRGDVNLHGVSRADATSRWGDLREKKASRTLQSFSGKLPPRYERLLQQYFKELSREK